MSSLLPPNATPQERALDEVTARLAEVPVPLRTVWNPDTCSSAVLPWLAWAFSLDAWDDTWSDAQKRSAIKASIGVHQKKGTIGAVKRALSAIGVSVRVQEWFNQIPAGVPYTYRLLIDINQNGVSQEALQRIVDVVQTSKNLRSHADAIIHNVKSEAEVFTAAVALSGFEIGFARAAGDLVMDGSFRMDGTQNMDAIKD